MELPPARTWRPLLDLAIEEDVGTGDITSALVVSRELIGEAVVEARQPLVACGLPIAEAVFGQVDPELAFRILVAEGQQVGPGTPLATVRGAMRGILTGERTALNFLMRLCGVATHTRRFVDAVEGTGTRLVDTRKTLPGWRALDKYATAVGGADNHRAGLYDGILLKDNHIAAAGGVAPAVKNALAGAPANLRVQVEVESESDALAAIEAGADFLLLDNWSAVHIARAAPQLRERALLEASGGIHLDNARAYAETGVHRISIGALTHTAPAADVALEIRNGADLLGGVAT